MPDFSSLSLETTFFNNTLFDYIKVFATFIGLVILTRFFSKLLNFVTNKLSQKSSGQFIKLALEADNRLGPVLLYLPVYFVAHSLKLHAVLVKFIEGFWLLILGYCAVRYLLDIVALYLESQVKKASMSQLVATSTRLIVAIILWPLALLFVISNLGFNISTLLAGVGIGGMAIALASQTLLADLFNYFTIIVDKPFTIGDDIDIGGTRGKVTYIGLKGTRLLSLSGEQIIISNTDATKSVMRNYQVMGRQLVKFILGIRYDTPSEKVKLMPTLIGDIIQASGITELVRVSFIEFGDSALNFEISYYVLSERYQDMDNKRQEINYKILDALETNGIGLAFPTSSVYLEK